MACSFALGLIFNRQPLDITEIPDRRTKLIQKHEYPFINWIHKDNELSFLRLLNRFPYPCSWPFAFTFMDD